jgi:hypothetical protein
VFENRFLRRIFWPKRDEVTGEWKKLHNEELHNLYSSPDIIRQIMSRGMKWAGHFQYPTLVLSLSLIQAMYSVLSRWILQRAPDWMDSCYWLLCDNKSNLPLDAILLYTASCKPVPLPLDTILTIANSHICIYFEWGLKHLKMVACDRPLIRVYHTAVTIVMFPFNCCVTATNPLLCNRSVTLLWKCNWCIGHVTKET